MPFDINEIAARCRSVTPVGSRVTCDPPPMDTDEDFLVLVNRLETAEAGLKALGFESSIADRHEYDGAEGSFVSYRRGDTNLLVTTSDTFHDAFLAASHVAKKLNLLRKEDRILLFQAVLYRNRYGVAS